jgi:hypothetical protein
MDRFLLASLLLCLSTPLLAAPPVKVQASYDVITRNIRVATITETFSRTHDRYTIESISEAIGLLALFKPETIRVNSEGAITAQGLRPLTYTSTRKLDVERNARADLDWEKHFITLHDRAGQHTLPLPAGTQDRLSAMYQLMFLPLQEIPTLKFFMTNGSKVDDYTYTITHGQSVTVPLGTFKAVYAASPPEKNASRTEIWMAAEHDNFPYKVVITDPDGSQFTQVLTRIDFTP